MSDDDDFEAISPELGASSSLDAVSPSMTTVDSERSDAGKSSDEESPIKKRRTHKKDTRDWALVARLDKRDHEPEEIEALIFSECKKQMEITRLSRLVTDKQVKKDNDIGLWKHTTFWSTCKGTVQY